MIMKSEYLKGKISREEYYKQFVNAEVLKMTEIIFGIQLIQSCHCPHFSEIKIYLWDRLQMEIRPYVSEEITACSSPYKVSIADYICVCKEAARMIKNKN